jgi:GNAT superfamily N-acetyltransferase
VGILSRLWGALRRLLARHNILRFERGTVFKLGTAMRPAGNSVADVSVEQGDAAAIDCLVRWGLDARGEYEGRIDRGEVLFLARIGGVPVGFLWVAFGRWDSPWIEHCLPLDGDIWIHDVFVDPSHRRHGIYRAMLRRVLRWAEEKGHAHAYCLVMRRNRASMLAHERNGWLPFEVISYWRLLFLARQRIWGARGRSAMTRVGRLVWRRGADLRACATSAVPEGGAFPASGGLRLGQGVERSGVQGPG